jgi:hypothetical protein
MSVLPLKADIRRRHRDVSFGPKAAFCGAVKTSLFDDPSARVGRA